MEFCKSSPPSSVSPFVVRRRASRFAFILFFLAIVTAFLQNILVRHLFLTRDRVLIEDASGRFHAATAYCVDDGPATEILQYVIRQCVPAMLARNTKGLLHHELAGQLMLKTARQRLESIMALDKSSFEERNMVQSPVFNRNRIRFRFMGTDFVQARVDGELVRSAIFKGRHYEETLGFRLRLDLARNPYSRKNSLLPFAVTHFELKTWMPEQTL